MVKLFIIATLLLIGILVYFAYKYKGETGYEETLKAMCKMFVAYLIISALMIVYKAEIRNFVMRIKPSQEINWGVALKPEERKQQTNSRVDKISAVEKTIYADEKRSCFCVNDLGDVGDFLEAAKRKDVEYIDNMLLTGKAFVVRRNTRVICSDSGAYDGIVFVTFLEGKFAGRRAYTFSKRVR